MTRAHRHAGHHYAVEITTEAQPENALDGAEGIRSGEEARGLLLQQGDKICPRPRHSKPALGRFDALHGGVAAFL